MGSDFASLREHRLFAFNAPVSRKYAKTQEDSLVSSAAGHVVEQLGRMLGDAWYFVDRCI